jgi:hypothetical protein
MGLTIRWWLLVYVMGLSSKVVGVIHDEDDESEEHIMQCGSPD